MFRHVLRAGVLAAVAAAVLVFSGSALAAPSTPQLLTPSGPAVFGGPVTVSWTPASFDPGAFPKWYRLTVLDVTGPVLWPPPYDLFGTSKTINVLVNHKYMACVRAAEVLNGQQQQSPNSTCKVFNVFPKLDPKDFYWEEIKFPPDPPVCLTCPIWDVFFEQPDPRAVEIIRASRGFVAANVVGALVNPRGDATLIYGR